MRQRRCGRPQSPKDRPVETGPERRDCAWSCTVLARVGAPIAQIGRRQPRLPVMRMHEIRADSPARCRRPSSAPPRPERGEAPPVVGPVRAVAVAIGTARAVEEMRAHRARSDRARPAWPAQDRAVPPKRSAKACTSSSLLAAAPAPPGSRARSVSHSTPCPASAGGSAPATSASPPVLTSGKDLGGDGEDFHHRAQPVSWSIIVLGDQADALVGAAEALGVEIRVLADDQTFRNDDAPVDDDAG